MTNEPTQRRSSSRNTTMVNSTNNITEPKHATTHKPIKSQPLSSLIGQQPDNESNLGTTLPTNVPTFTDEDIIRLMDQLKMAQDQVKNGEMMQDSMREALEIVEDQNRELQQAKNDLKRTNMQREQDIRVERQAQASEMDMLRGNLARATTAQANPPQQAPAYMDFGIAREQLTLDSKPRNHLVTSYMMKRLDKMEQWRTIGDIKKDIPKALMWLDDVVDIWTKLDDEFDMDLLYMKFEGETREALKKE